MLKRPIWLATILLLLIFSTARAADDCPPVPSGLQSVSNLAWEIPGQTIRMNPGNSPENSYLHSGLEWDMVSGQLKPVTKPGTVEAIQFAEQNNISQAFFSRGDDTSLELSPSLKFGLYTQKDSALYVLYSASMDSDKGIKLGMLSENLSGIRYTWFSDKEAVVTIEPIYSSFYQVLDVCLDGSCFIDLSELINEPIERPDILTSTGILAIYNDSDTSKIWLYSLNTKKIVSEFQLSIRLLPNLNPIWSQDGMYLYLVGFNQDLSRLLVYRFNVDTQELTTITELDPSISTINEWLIAPENNLVILSTPGIIVKCYS